MGKILPERSLGMWKRLAEMLASMFGNPFQTIVVVMLASFLVTLAFFVMGLSPLPHR